MPFISQILQTKQNREIKGHEYLFSIYWQFEITRVLKLRGSNLLK